MPLAAAWSIKDPANPYYHDKKLLAAIGKGGEALVDAQDKDGMWLFRKKDNSTWGQIYMPWTYGAGSTPTFSSGTPCPRPSGPNGKRACSWGLTAFPRPP